MRESQIEKYLVKRVKAFGGEIRKIRFLDRRGAPDRLLISPSGDVWFIELKAPGKKLQAHQLREIRRLKKKGALVVVLDSLKAVESFTS